MPRHNDFQWREVDPRWNAGSLPRNPSRMLPQPQHLSWRSTLSQSRPLCIGMDGHTDTIAVASVAPDHGAAVTPLGTRGTRQGDSAQLMRTMPSQAPHLLFGSEAGPCGSWLDRYLRHQDDDCWVVAPSRMPHKAGARVQTDRRDAIQLARLARSGDLTVVAVPQGQEEARRDLTRARAEAISALKDAQGRLQACVLRHDIRDPGRAQWGPGPPAVALCRGLSHAHATQCFSRLRPSSPGAYRTPPTARASTPRARASLAVVPGGRGSAGLARRAMHGGRHPASSPGCPAPVCDPQSTDAMRGLDSRSILLRGATPTGVDDPSRHQPCPTRARRKRLGLSRSRASQPTVATATRTTTPNPPGHPWESASAAVSS
jgi:hypothetical protein